MGPIRATGGSLLRGSYLKAHLTGNEERSMGLSALRVRFNFYTPVDKTWLHSIPVYWPWGAAFNEHRRCYREVQGWLEYQWLPPRVISENCVLFCEWTRNRRNQWTAGSCMTWRSPCTNSTVRFCAFSIAWKFCAKWVMLWHIIIEVMKLVVRIITHSLGFMVALVPPSYLDSILGSQSMNVLG